MREPTVDSEIFIIEKIDDRIVYETTNGEQWEITGTCAACGECEVNASDIYYDGTDENEKFPKEKHYQIWTGVPVGEPNACHDVRYGNRLDVPVRPEMTTKFENCTLSGRYLNGN